MRNNNFKKRFNKISRYFLILVTICTFSLSCEKAPDIEEITEMSFTIDTRLNPDNPTDKSYRVPIFANKKLSSYSLIIEWGDGTSTEYPKGTALKNENCTHTYAVEGEYQITIKQTKYNSTAKLEYEFNPGSVRIENIDAKKLVSMDSPMLRVLYKEPDGLEIFTASGIFDRCSNLKSIHPDLFKNNADITVFISTFNDCESLTEIPADLFKYNVNATKFYSAFSNCTSLTEIPADLFKYNVNAGGFGYTFFNCTSLTEIPADLFKYNVNAVEFMAVFENCTSLTEAPDGLFKYNILASSFVGTFKSCYNLKLNPNIFCEDNYDGKYSRFATFAHVRLQSCFQDVGRDLTDVSGSVAPELWKYRYADGADVLIQTDCFKNTNVANANDVPDSWTW